MPDGTSCLNHKIPSYSARYAPVIGVVGKWLMLCGGDSTQDCRKLDLTSPSPSWQQGVNLPYRSRYGMMYTIDNYLYILGGYDGYYGYYRNYHYRISETGSSWEGRAAFPRNEIHKAAAVVDEDNSRVFILGGRDYYYWRSEVYIYTPSSNSWSSITNYPESGMIAATIVKQNSGKRWLVAQSYSSSRRSYAWNIDDWNGWHHISTNPFYHNRRFFFLSLTPYTAFGLGGETNINGISKQNFFAYSPENQRFEMQTKFLSGEHAYGYWTTARRDLTVLNNCNAERTYVAVGYSGNDYVGFLQCMHQ